MKKTNADYFGCMLLGLGYLGSLAAIVWVVWMICEYARSIQ